ncbi:hypothetical protein CO026_02580 [Candidatus Kaiserbacteria bacterium CG_4_9_14_0_2_um_filter_41_32]|uniref:CvpA family protein n=1 Tax=Candidatus Kaiserbacteria bacterium CG_4_9_14_0_2_um_filter_41_32 TaxID=1974601 RepID=A0A2M8FEE9_9BACT|nr:MAG: hypothetical protein CO026_02580 [Candidatus Kaiserbacteria bacterium CG_4_9_14_0_2_um_filter_41_32]
MDTAYIFSILQELIFILLVFGFFLGYGIFRGRQAVINVITGLYLALLISLEFPYYDVFLAQATTAHSESIGKLLLFAIFTFLATILITRVMPNEFREKKFESFGKKLLLAVAGTILIMVFSFHVLPVTEFLTPGTPIQSLFAPAQYFFWWLLVPFVILYLN